MVKCVGMCWNVLERVKKCDPSVVDLLDSTTLSEEYVFMDYLINAMYGISEMALNKDSYHLVFLLNDMSMYFLIDEKVGKILQKQISEQRLY